MSAKQTKTNTKKARKKKADIPQPKFKRRTTKLVVVGSVVAIGIGSVIAINSASPAQISATDDNGMVVVVSSEEGPLAKDVLEKLKVKAVMDKEGYSREEFYNSWPSVGGCGIRQRIIRREFGKSAKLCLMYQMTHYYHHLY